MNLRMNLRRMEKIRMDRQILGRRDLRGRDVTGTTVIITTTTGIASLVRARQGVDKEGQREVEEVRVRRSLNCRMHRYPTRTSDNQLQAEEVVVTEKAKVTLTLSLFREIFVSLRS